MKRPRTVRLGVALPFLLAAALCGCGGSPSDAQTTARGLGCGSDARADTYAVGLAKHAQSFSIKLLDASPAPPAKGVNTWKIQVLDGSGSPLDGATIGVTPFMPDHGHGTSVIPGVQALGGGEYTISNVYLFMPGLWQVTFQVNGAGVPQGSVVFAFCIDG